MPRDDDHRASGNKAVVRIADFLECSVEDLLDGAGGRSDTKGASELLGLWIEIEDAGDRAELLNLARTLAES